MLARAAPQPGEGPSAPINVVFDPDRKLFMAPLDPFILAGDRFQLLGGYTFSVAVSQVYAIGGIPCFQEIACLDLGQQSRPLRDSWDGGMFHGDDRDLEF